MAKCPCQFSESIPWECIRELTRIIRSGSIISERWTALAHLACLAGSMAAQSNQEVGRIPYEGTEESLLTLCTELEELDSGGGHKGPVDRYLMLLLMRFLEKAWEWWYKQ